MQSLNINVSKIDKSALFEGKQGSYLNLTLMDNRDGPDQYGNDGFIVQDVGKQRREAGERGPIIGNWKHLGQSRSPNQNGARPPEGARSPEFGKKEQPRDNQGALPDDDDIPFARFEPPF